MKHPTAPQKTQFSTWILVAIVVSGAALVVDVAAVAANEGEKKPATAEPQSATETSPILKAARQTPPEPVKVYTNADLKRPLFDTADSAPASDTSVTPPVGATTPPRPGESPSPRETEDPLVWMRDRQVRAEERVKQREAADQRVADAKARVAMLEKRLLSIKNPFLAREKAPEDDKDWGGQNSVQRRDRSRVELEQAREELRKAQSERNSLN